MRSMMTFKKIFFALLIMSLPLYLSVVVMGADDSYDKLAIQQVANSDNKDLSIYFCLKNSKDVIVDWTKEVRKEDFALTVGKNEAEIDNIKKITSAEITTDYLFLVDVSKSMNKTQLSDMKAFISAFADMVKDGDSLGIVTFGENVSVRQNFTADRAAWKKAADGLLLTDNQTKLFGAVIKAAELFEERDNKQRKVAILLTDGKNDSTDGISKSDAMQKLKSPLETFYIVACGEEEKYNLSELAKQSKGSLNVLYGKEPIKVAEKVYSDIANTYILRSKDYQVKNKRNGDLCEIELTDIKNKNVLGDMVFASVASRESVNWKNSRMLRYGAATVLVIIVVLLIILLALKRKKNRQRVIENSQAENGKSNNCLPRQEINQVAYTVAEPEEKQDKKRSLAEIDGSSYASERTGVKMQLIAIGKTKNALRREFYIDEMVRIGKGRNCEVIIPSNNKEDEDCILHRKENRFYLESLATAESSTIAVNGVPVNDIYQLEDDDVICIGSYEYRLKKM